MSKVECSVYTWCLDAYRCARKNKAGIHYLGSTFPALHALFYDVHFGSVTLLRRMSDDRDTARRHYRHDAVRVQHHTLDTSKDAAKTVCDDCACFLYAPVYAAF